MINQLISDMMKRDVYFKERMEELGYTHQPIVAVVDWQQEMIYTMNETMSLHQCSDEYVRLLQETKKAQQKRSLLTEKAIVCSKQLVEDAPDFGVDTSTVQASRAIFHSIFMYEMLLLNEIEDELPLTLDDRLHLVGHANLTQGVDDTSKRLTQEVQEESGFGQEDWGLVR